MIKLTHFDPSNRANATVWIRAEAIIGLSAAQPHGTLLVLPRGTYHVSQSVDQVLKLMDGA